MAIRQDFSRQLYLLRGRLPCTGLQNMSCPARASSRETAQVLEGAVRIGVNRRVARGALHYSSNMIALAQPNPSSPVESSRNQGGSARRALRSQSSSSARTWFEDRKS